MRGQLQIKQAKLFGGSKIGDGHVFPTLRSSQSDGREVRAPPLIAGRVAGRRSGELVRPKASPKATEALCVNRVPWVSNSTTLPTALAARSSTPSSSTTIPRPFQISKEPEATTTTAMAVEGGATSPGPREKLDAQIKSADMVRTTAAGVQLWPWAEFWGNRRTTCSRRPSTLLKRQWRNSPSRRYATALAR
ncbi:hypothetical protein FJTKL_15186 [Diaporthe vaccinii]|uniref:Uncharacterized protein n=1 Tax=Diaporthe vaccinii TaxID=105482 RepID=A0ABR4E5R9_9PEZI